ncbi:unnamed protein product [Meganyctiphanes norvegica]|uniref:Uncharacterized protein n=1 Tax=Meganyctiphanes norvegica TaxID=48144 RepID=A0AAV2RSE0_MEGNR
MDLANSAENPQRNYEYVPPAKTPRLIGIVFFFSLSIMPIAIGSIHKDNCPVQPMIPIWCISYGVMMMVSSLLELSILMRGETEGKTAMLVRLIHGFIIIWFVVGCVYTYSNNEPDYDPEDDGFCDKHVYGFSFWFLTSHFIVLIISMFLCCCCACLGVNLF